MVLLSLWLSCLIGAPSLPPTPRFRRSCSVGTCSAIQYIPGGGWSCSRSQEEIFHPPHRTLKNTDPGSGAGGENLKMDNKIIGLIFTTRKIIYLLLMYWFKIINISYYLFCFVGLPWSSAVEEFACNSGDPSLIPGSGRSPGEGMATHSCILAWRTPMDRGAWQVPLHGVAENQTGLSDFHFILFCNMLFWYLEWKKARQLSYRLFTLMIQMKMQNGPVWGSELPLLCSWTMKLCFWPLKWKN